MRVENVGKETMGRHEEGMRMRPCSYLHFAVRQVHLRVRWQAIFIVQQLLQDLSSGGEWNAFLSAIVLGFLVLEDPSLSRSTKRLILSGLMAPPACQPGTTVEPGDAVSSQQVATHYFLSDEPDTDVAYRGSRSGTRVNQSTHLVHRLQPDLQCPARHVYSRLRSMSTKFLCRRTEYSSYPVSTTTEASST
ncbi:hypothetical protein BDW74DRAFT_72021 [Aspergillus multicolor]|uniref:uncharacterized protein n=1 Tax=Aspergillus multicolor TaxID=41759 RepID=UPI003CCCFEE0